MPTYIVEHNGVKLTVNTLAEAIQATKELSATYTAPISYDAPEKPEPPATDGGSVSAAKDALKLLKLLRDNPRGIGHEEIQNIWGVENSKGLGPKTGAVDRILHEIYSFPPDSVYTREKTPNGRIWKPGKLIGDAITALSDFISLL